MIALRLLAPRALLCAVAWLGAVGASPAPSVDYRLSPVIQAGQLQALQVEIRFAADRSGTTRLDLPRSWADGRELWRNLRDLKVEGAASVAMAGPANRVIRSAPGAPLRVSYRVVSAYDHDPTVTDSRQSAPVIRPAWFYAVGDALFAAPSGRENVAATFQWDAAGSGLGFASDLEHLASPHRPASRPGIVQDVAESIVIGGRDLTVTRGAGALAGVRVASLGRYAFDHAAFDRQALEVIAAERRFWGDRGDDPFLVTLAPLQSQPGVLSLSGTGRSDAFALWVAVDAPLARLRWLLAHEYFHTWNAVQLGSLDDGAAEPLGYWFSEGFTDFYARRLMVREGLIAPAEFVELWNETLLAYAGSSARNLPNAQTAAQFWSDPEVQKIPYQRGAMLAAVWDARLRAKSGGRVSLDDVMRAQRTAAAGLAAKPKGGAAALFVPTAQRFGLDVRGDVARYVERGDTLTLPADVFGACVTVESQELPVFDRGFDSEATASAGNVVTGLRPSSRAYAAGLRNGMKLLARIEGQPGDPRIDYVLEVQDGPAVRLFRYRPVGERRVALQQLKLVPPGLDSAARQACARTLGGAQAARP